MADISNIESKINDIEVGFNKPVSEQLMNRVGGDINNLIDENNAQDARMTAIESTAFNQLFSVALDTTGEKIIYTVPAGKFFSGGAIVESMSGAGAGLTGVRLDVINFTIDPSTGITVFRTIVLLPIDIVANGAVNLPTYGFSIAAGFSLRIGWSSGTPTSKTFPIRLIGSLLNA